jgi:hypothetical protein
MARAVRGIRFAVARCAWRGVRWGALLMIAGLLTAPASGGEINGCCICQGCTVPPATQCFESPAAGCETQCSILNCADFIDTAVSCGQQTQCPAFSAPAPAPALGPAGLALAALGLAAVALRRYR